MYNDGVTESIELSIRLFLYGIEEEKIDKFLKDLICEFFGQRITSDLMRTVSERAKKFKEIEHIDSITQTLRTP